MHGRTVDDTVDAALGKIHLVACQSARLFGTLTIVQAIAYHLQALSEKMYSI